MTVKSNVRLINTFKVSYCYRECGSVEIQATSEEQAERIVQRHMDEDGVDTLSTLCSYSTSHREYGVDDVEELLMDIEEVSQ